MNKLSKASLLIAGLSMVGLVVTRLILGAWFDFLWAFAGVALVSLGLVVVLDRAVLIEFFTMKTTKHGMNMGVMIILMIVGLFAVNFISIKRDKKFDWTSEGLNSLSDQSIKAAQNLKSDLEVILMYRKGAQGEEESRRSTRELVTLFQNYSKSIKYQDYNALTNAALAKELEFNFGNSGVFVRQGTKKIRVDQPTEENLTKAILKITRTDKKVIYFVTGHDEKGLENRQPETISEFKKDLENTYDVKTLELFKESKVPADAALVAIVGPRKPFLEPEIKALRDYAKTGGAIFIAADPGEKSNIPNLTKPFGIEYKNNFLIDVRAQVPGAGPVAALGTEFSKSSPLTSSINAPFSVFLMSSSLAKDAGAKDITTEDLVKTGKEVMSTAELTEGIKYAPNGPHTIGMLAKGKIDGSDKEFQAVVFGDSDFMANGMMMTGGNRDLAGNIFAGLAKDQDLISIRPKEPKGTRLQMSREQQMILLLGFLVPLPIVMFVLGGVIWHRRKTA